MLKHISISQLRPGMYVIDPGLDWMSNPYLFMENVYVDSEEAVQNIVEQGYLEVYIDLARSECAPLPAPLVSDGNVTAGEKKPSLTPTVPFEEELRAAIKVHDESVKYARTFMRDIQKGKLSMGMAAEAVDGIMGSLERNANALLSLSRLHHSDSYTYTHCVNVCILATMYARCQGLDNTRTFVAGLAGMFHDLGKALIPGSILNAPRKLTNAEMNVMRSHPALGHKQLSAVAGIESDVLLGALHHHEKANGTGYPSRLKGDEISVIGRIVAVADIYDALTSKRAYKEAMYPYRALAIMYEMRDKDLDYPTLARFIRMLGVYPAGSVVGLDDGTYGVVCQCSPEQPSKPMVRVVKDAQGRTVKMRELDLGAEGAPAITQCLSPEEAGIDPAKVLGMTD